MYVVSCHLIVIGVLFVVCESTNHSGSRLVRARPQTEDQLTSLVTFLNHEAAKGYADIWSISRQIGDDVTFAVTADKLQLCLNWMRANNIEYYVDAKDLKRLAEEDAARNSARRTFSAPGDAIALDEYNDHDQINEYLSEVNNDCSICELLNIGQSYESRTMTAIQIGRFSLRKKSIWIDAGIHAREWVAPAAALNIIKYLTDGYHERDPDVLWLLDHYVWFILPSANPDGYMYSRTQDRYWRKTRSPNSGSECDGTDPNRNWDIHWGEVGTDPDPCTEIFPGPTAFSEVETRNIRDFLLKHSSRLVVYLSLHSYGQYWLYPWGYDSSLPDNWQELDRVGSAATEAINDTYGMTYVLGSSANVLYPAAGGSDDWARGVADIRYSYTVELRDEGDYGFLLPAEQIIPTSQELWAGIKAMARAINEKQ